MPDPGVFLIHGLGGTQYDLGSMHKRLKRAGFVTHSLTLPGHGTRPEDLCGVRAEDWLEAVRAKYREIIDQHETLHVMGMCMGALLAVETVKREQHTRGRLVALAPPVYIDGWATPWYRGLRPLLYRIPGVPNRMKVEEEEPFGIRNEQLREIVKAKFARGENFHYQWVPLACIREVDRLRRYVRKGLQRMLVLEASYHMVCVDNDRELVARNVLEFFEASVGTSLGMAGAERDDARMTPEQMAELLVAARADLEQGDLAALYARGKGEFAWFQPGANRTSGVYRGDRGLARLREWADAGLAFTAFGAPVLNTGMAVVPATLRSGTLASQGVLAFALRDGKLLEARWFPDEVALEDAHFGGTPALQGPGPAEKAFEAAAALSKTLRQAPDNDTLLSLYALYKQGSAGDVSGDRPGMMDMVRRAKYDAWAARRGLPREQAMRDYVALVNQLKAAETQSA